MNTHDEIAKAAHDLWEKSGRIDGYDLENWLAAERIVADMQKEKIRAPKEIETGKKGKPGRKGGNLRNKGRRAD